MLDNQNPAQWTAVAAAEAIRDGAITSEELVKACLDRIREVDGTIQAWAYLDPDYALDQARRADRARRAGRPLGPLHGIPVGIKDILDTSDMPTENGTVLHAGRRPMRDSTVVALLREAGAVIMGKTVTTELAVFAPSKTTNPHNPAHTPGGSSSGSAAAVAANMVPLAVGTQTNGSVIRPASFCGVYGFKPSHGHISRHGVLMQSPPLDTVGVYARTVEDIALIAETLMAFDDRDAHMRPRARPRLLETAMAPPPVEPHFAFVKSPVWDHASEDIKDGLAELVDHLGGVVEEVALPDTFDQVVRWHRTIMEADLAKNFRFGTKEREQLSGILREMMDRGETHTAVAYNEAIDHVPLVRAQLEAICEAYDAILTPATTGEAPLGLETTGSPIFCTLWTYCGMPAVSVPLLEGSNGLPMGVQVVGRKGDDARLLRTVRWLLTRIS